MDWSMPGFPVHHQLPELTQTHVHWVDDAIQQSHPLLSPSPTFDLFLASRVFSNKSVLRIRCPKISRDRVSRDGKGEGPRGAQDKDSYRRGAPRVSERGWGGGESKTREQEVVQVGSEGSAPGMRAHADGRSGRRRPERRTSRQTWEQDDRHRYTCGSLVRMEGESLSRLGSRESSRGSETGHTFYPKEKQF